MIQMWLGQAATLRGLEILTNLGCDVRILQMKDAKDPDEYVIKYGNVRFNSLVEEAISLVEFKVKMLKNNLNLDNTNDKIKFLNEIAKLLSSVDNKIEQEIYIEAISKEHKISKEAIYAETNKLNYSKSKGSKLLEKPVKTTLNVNTKQEDLSRGVLDREELILSLLINEKDEIYEKIKGKISKEDIIEPINKKIIQKLYEEFEKGNSNINSVLDFFSDDEETVSRLTKVMTKDYEIKNIEKALNDVLNIYEKEKLVEERNDIIEKLKDNKLDKEEILELEKQLQDIVIKLTQIK